jgi:hypothetical protein
MRIIAAIALIAVLTACGREVSPKSDGWIYVQDDGGSASIKEITMPSGTRCVVMIGMYKAAMSCDWR